MVLLAITKHAVQCALIQLGYNWPGTLDSREAFGLRKSASALVKEALLPRYLQNFT